MAIKKKSKPTLKEVMGTVGMLMMRINKLEADIANNARVVDEYIQFKDDKDNYIEFLKEKLEIDDQDNKEAEKE